MKLTILILLLSPLLLFCQSKNEIKFHYGEYLYNWTFSDANHIIFGPTKSMGINYTRTILQNKKTRMNVGFGYNRFTAEKFRKLVTINGQNSLINADVDSDYANIVFSGEYYFKKKWSLESTFNNLIFLEKETEFVYQNRFYSNIDVGINYSISKNILLGVSSKVNILSIADFEIRTFDPSVNIEKHHKIRPGGLGLSAVLKYRF